MLLEAVNSNGLLTPDEVFSLFLQLGFKENMAAAAAAAAGESSVGRWQELFKMR